MGWNIAAINWRPKDTNRKISILKFLLAPFHKYFLLVKN